MPALLLPSGVPRNPVMRPRERADPQPPCGEVGGQRRRMRGKPLEIDWLIVDRSRIPTKTDGRHLLEQKMAEQESSFLVSTGAFCNATHMRFKSHSTWPPKQLSLKILTGTRTHDAYSSVELLSVHGFLQAMDTCGPLCLFQSSNNYRQCVFACVYPNALLFLLLEEC